MLTHLIIRSPIMTDAVWCIPLNGNISSMSYAIMMNADWGIPPSGTLDKFRGAFVTMPIGASRQAVHSIYHSIHICDGFRLMNPVLIIIHFHSVFKYHISIPYSLTYYLFKDILNLRTYFIYSFHSYLANYQYT